MDRGSHDPWDCKELDMTNKWKNNVFSTDGTGKIDIHMQNNDVWISISSFYQQKNKERKKMNQKPKYKG